jgi:hypothetical protein
VEVGTGTVEVYSTDKTDWCQSSPGYQGTTLYPSFIYYPSSAAWYTRRNGVTVGQDFIGTLVDELAESGTPMPQLESCTIRNGEGAPRVHVAVSALTDHASTTLRKNGAFPTTGAPTSNPPAEVTPAPQPPLPAPETTKPALVNQPLPTTALPANTVPVQTNDQNVVPPHSGNEPAPSNGNSPPAHPTVQPAPIHASSLTIGTVIVPVTAIGSSHDGGVVIGGSTLLPSSVVTFQDHTLSLGPSGTNVIIVGTGGPSTVALFGPGVAPAVTGSPQPAKSIVIGTQSIPLSFASSTEQGVILPGGTTLAPGSVVTFDGQTLSLAADGSSIVVAASGSQSTVVLYPLAPTVLNVGSSPYTVAYATAAGGGLLLPGGQTLLPGATTVIDGTTLSLESHGTALVVGTSTVPLQAATVDDGDVSTTAAGSYIGSGNGGGVPSATDSTSASAEFTAGAGRTVEGWRSGAGLAACWLYIFHYAGLA